MVPEEWGLQRADALQAARPRVPLNVGIQWDSRQGEGTVRMCVCICLWSCVCL